MEKETIAEFIRLSGVFPVFQIIVLGLLILLTIILFNLGLKKTDLKYQWLLSRLSIWIGLFGGISLAFGRVNMWSVYIQGTPKQDYWAADQMGIYFRLGVHLSLALVSWSLSIALKLILDKKIANQQVDPIVKTPVDEVEAQGTQGHP